MGPKPSVPRMAQAIAPMLPKRRMGSQISWSPLPEDLAFRCNSYVFPSMTVITIVHAPPHNTVPSTEGDRLPQFTYSPKTKRSPGERVPLVGE